MNDISIKRWSDVENRADTGDALDEIFFESSLKKSFVDVVEEESFRNRWMGRYLDHYPNWFYVAYAGNGVACGRDVAGYLAGCAVDPRSDPLFSDIGYFALFDEHLKTYPAHLHINLARQFRGAGIGGRLIKAFFNDVERAGVRGVHVVTGAASRNVSFYLKSGFTQVARADWNGSDNVFLGARL